MTTRKNALPLATVIVLVAGMMSAQDTKYPPQGEQIPGPDYYDESEHCCYSASQPRSREEIAREWLADVEHWRLGDPIWMGVDGVRDAPPGAPRAQSRFFHPPKRVQKRFFFSP